MVHLEETVRAIDLLTSGQGGVDVIDVEPDGDVRLTAFDGSVIVVRVVHAEFAAPAPRPDPPREVFETRPEWPIEELRALGYPPEWNRAWLVRSLARHRGVEEAARHCGRPAASLREFKEVHGIENAMEEYARSLWATGRYATQETLAAELGVSKATASRYVGGARMNGKRAERNEVVRRVVLQVLDEHAELLDRRDVRAFNDAVLKVLREAHGETRSRDKLTYLIDRVRQESGR